MRKLLSLMLLFFALGVQAQTREYLTVDGKQRTMLVYVPQDLPENAPLVITLHGFNQSAQYQMEHTKWNTVAESEKFIIVYPDYDGGWWDVNGTKDTRFIEKIMENMNKRYKSDLNRVYVSGFSLGAMMTYHCIEVLANKVAAFAPVSGVRFDNKAPESPRIVPIIHTHCKGDDVFKWGGDPQHASGGYPYIPDYVKSWATYFGMNPTPEITDPYKASDVDLTVYRRDDSVVEVRLLSFDGAGHWHVDADGWGGVSTTWEIWNFCKRYTLNLDDVTPPQLVSISPEDMSFDLPQGQRDFSVIFDYPALKDFSIKLEGNGVSIPIEFLDDEDCTDKTTNQACFRIPDGVEIPDGNYILTIDGIRTEQGEFTRSYEFEYTYGVEETGDKLNVETIFEQDWTKMFEQNGERMPEGWQRVSTKTDGKTETITSADDAGTGSCLKYIWEYGDITTGLFLTARDLQSCNVNYGRISGKTINLPIGKYVLSFNSAYWDKGSQRAKATFDVTMVSKSNRGGTYKTVVKGSKLKPEGCTEGGNHPTFQTKYNEYTFKVERKDNYVLNFDINMDKVAVCIGNVKVTTAPSNADKYKGEFLRMMKYAEDLYAEAIWNSQFPGEEEMAEKAAALKAVMDKYENLASTAPSVYTAAMEELYAAMKPLIQLPTSNIEDVTSTATPVSTTYFTIDGRKNSSPLPGINIVRKTYSNGTTEVKKIMQ